MAKRKKQQKGRSSKPAKSPAQKPGSTDELIFEPDPRTGSRLLLRIGIALVIAWILVLLVIAINK